MKDEILRTQKGYESSDAPGTGMSNSMEDYLEMIVRIHASGETVRIKELARRLSVKPSSASKMAELLRERGYVDFEPYGYIIPTRPGLETGEYLLRRHDILRRFFAFINGGEADIGEVEQTEHYLSRRTVGNIEELLQRLERNCAAPDTETGNTLKNPPPSQS